MFSQLLLRLLLALTAISSFTHAVPIPDDTTDLVRRAVTQAGAQVVVDAGGVYMRATRMNSGDIIGAYAKTVNGQKTIQAVKSTNGGNSWTALGTVTTATDTNQDLDNAYPLQLANGNILCAFRNHDRSSPTVYTVYRITLCVSTDGGVTWTFLAQIDQRTASTSSKNGVWEPLLRLANDGSLQAYYSSENADNDQDNVLRVSTNGGSSWGSMLTVSGNGVTSRDGMVGVAEIDGNGNLIAVFENTESGSFTVDYVKSSNDGLTWGSRTRLYTPSSGTAGAPQVVNVGGTLVADFMTNEDGGSDQLDGGEMKVVTSTDGGNTWSGATTTGDTGSHWPGMYTVNDSTFLALYSFNGKGLVSQAYTV